MRRIMLSFNATVTTKFMWCAVDILFFFYYLWVCVFRVLSD